MNIYFTDYFGVSPKVLEKYGAFNISLINDLPLFIDPFLLFASDKPEYQRLHEQMITYLKFLRDQVAKGALSQGRIRDWFLFPEIRQLWLGFSKRGNAGSGLGHDFADGLNAGLAAIFRDFGNEKVTQGTHLEKVCLVSEGVGRDNISDFTANLIKDFLCKYTQAFALKYIPRAHLRKVVVDHAEFNYTLLRWMHREYLLPWLNDDFVLLTPRDMLTKDENWINRPDLIYGFERIANAVPDEVLRAQLNGYVAVRLREKMPDKERRKVYSMAVREFPSIIEYFILDKELGANDARQQSELKVAASEDFYILQVKRFTERLAGETGFYKICGDTYSEARERILFLKEEIEHCGAHKLFYRNGKPIQNEHDLQILYRLTWFATPSDFNSEVNNGRGPVDFKISRGSGDKTIVEFKLAKNSRLEQNLQRQVEIYKNASRTAKAIKVIFYFSEQELVRVQSILDRLKMQEDVSVILIDVRADNKPSGSRA